MLVDWGATIHLVWGDEPFVSPWENVVGEFAGVRPPAVTVGTEAKKTTLLEGAKAHVLLGGVVSVDSVRAPIDHCVHLRTFSLRAERGAVGFRVLVD